MKNNKKFLAIIPARSGSKELRDKNILNLNRKPLLSYPIKSALNSKYIDKVILSTDSKKYTKIGKRYGAEIPFLRPKIISKDETPSSSFILHALNFFVKKRLKFDYIVLLEPTSPLTRSIDIDKAIDKIISSKCTSLVSVAKSKINKNDLFEIKKNLIKLPKKKLNFHTQRQKNINYFMDGSIYISKVKNYIKNKSFISNKTFSYIIKDKIKNIVINNKNYLDYLKFCLIKKGIYK